MLPWRKPGWQAHIDIPWNKGRAEADLPGSTDDESPVWSNIGLGSGRLTVPAGPEPTPVNRRMDRSARSLMRESLLYLGGALTILWGMAHLYPTKKVVHSFGRITRDNQLILTMEWIAEAIPADLRRCAGRRDDRAVRRRRRSDSNDSHCNSRDVARPVCRVGSHRWARRLHHVPPMHADLRPLRNIDPRRGVRIARPARGAQPHGAPASRFVVRAPSLLP